MKIYVFMKNMKKIGKYIGIIMICLFCSYLTTLATNYAFNMKKNNNEEPASLPDEISVPFTHTSDYLSLKTTIGNDSLHTTAQNVIGAVNELNTARASHFQSLGTSDNPITSLNSIPLNSTGHVVLDSTISPSGYTRAYSYWKSGTNASTAYSILAIDQYDFIMYMYDMYDSTSNGWKRITDTYNSRGQTAPANTSINNILTPGVYYVSTSNGHTNLPDSKTAGILVVLSPFESNTYARQIFYYSAVNFYARSRSNSSGTAWAGWYKYTGTKVT